VLRIKLGEVVLADVRFIDGDYISIDQPSEYMRGEAEGIVHRDLVLLAQRLVRGLGPTCDNGESAENPSAIPGPPVVSPPPGEAVARRGGRR
jgi:hypothetical protein